GGDRVVDDQRHAVLVGDVGHGLDVEHVDLRVADGLGEEQLGVQADGVAPRLRVVLVGDERRLDAELGQRVTQQVVSAAVDGRGGDYVVACTGDVQDRQGCGRHA